MNYYFIPTELDVNLCLNHPSFQLKNIKCSHEKIHYSIIDFCENEMTEKALRESKANIIKFKRYFRYRYHSFFEFT
jgi:hypothetical protein